MNYKILQATSTDELEKIVNAALSDGWACAGGLVILTPTNGPFDRTRFLQALTKQIGSIDPRPAAPAKAKA